ncbi:tetratricopeptide repeat protein [bacterium]|nr:tetratricopeptide repeat protein [bacterium]
MSFIFTILLIGQGNLGVQQVEASEVLQRKPKFAYKLPEWVTDEYLFAQTGFSLDDEIEKCIDATILLSELGGNPLMPALSESYEQLARLRPDSALKSLEMQLTFNPPPDARRQILLYRITADWLRGDLSGVKASLKTLEADKEASSGAPMEYIRSLVSYLEKGEIPSKDSLLYFLFVKRDARKAQRFLPSREVTAQALRYHLEDSVSTLPSGNVGRYLRVHRLVKAGLYSQAHDSLQVLSEIRTPYSSLVKYDMAEALLCLKKSREAHLAVPDTFLYQWLLPERALAMIRGRVEWMENRPDAARTWFKKASENPSYAAYSQWIIGGGAGDPTTQAYFEKRKASDLYNLLRVSGYIRKADYTSALLILGNMIQSMDMSSISSMSNIILAVYAACENEKKEYQLTLSLADAVKNRGQVLASNLGKREEDYFATAAHVAVGDAYYYSGGRYEKMARPYYEYAIQSSYKELRHQGYFGLAWGFLTDRNTGEVKKIVTALSADQPTEMESQTIIFLEGLNYYAARDFRVAAEVFSRLNFSSVPEMRMQGLYFEGRSYEQSGRFDLAASAYEDLLAAFPASEEIRDAWSRLARAQIQMGHPDRAEKTLEKLIEQAKLYHFQFSDIYKEILLVIFDNAMAKGDEEQAKEFAERLSRTQNSTLALETFYYRTAQKDTALWQIDHLIGIIARMKNINPESPYLPTLFLQAARMEIELGDYPEAVAKLESIIQWRRLPEVNDILSEASFELVRTLVLAKDWEKTIRQAEIYLSSYSDSDEYSSRVLYFLAFSLVKRAGNNDPLARKDDGKKALEVLEKLERLHKDSEFVKNSRADIDDLKKSAELLIK